MKYSALILFTTLATVGASVGCTEQTLQPADKILIPTEDASKVVHISYHPNGAIKQVSIVCDDSSQVVRVAFDDLAGSVLFTALTTKPSEMHAVEYYYNGRPKGLTNFDSTMTGDAVYYHSNGQKREEGRWSNGQQFGIWKRYSEDGTLVKTDTLK